MQLTTKGMHADTTSAGAEIPTTPSVDDINTDYTAGKTSEHQVGDNTSRSQLHSISIIDTGSISKQVYTGFRKFSVYIQFLLVILGIFTNACNIMVFTHTRMRSTTSTILTFLSCSELAVAIVELIMVSYTAVLGQRTYTSKTFWTLFQWIRVYLITVFQRSSNCFNILVAAQRFIAVRFPLKAKPILQRWNPLVFCVVISMTVLVIHIYNPLKMEVARIDTRRGVIYTIQNSKLYANDPAVFDVLSLLTKVIFSYIPLFGCLVLNVLMVMALWNHRKQTKMIQTNLSESQKYAKRQTQTTTTILVATFLFVLLSLPVTTSTIVQSTNPEYGRLKKEHYLFHFIVLLGGLLYLLSLSMDFFVYMILSREYRQTFTDLLRNKCGRHDGDVLEMATSITRSTEF